MLLLLFNSTYKVRRQVTKILGVRWCCGNYCLFAFVLWCGYCKVPFQTFILRHLVITPIRHLHIPHNAPYLPPKILHRHCFQFLLRRL